MKIFQCDNCGQLLFFENTHCGSCGSQLGYLWRQNMLSAVIENDGALEAVASPQARYKFCANHEHNACNWLVPESSEDPYCRACELNRTIPDLDEPAKVEAWQKLERAKHRLVYSLLRLQLPVKSRFKEHETGLWFDFLANVEGEDPIMTGHDGGLITMNIAEADDVQREATRKNMREPYRTLIGHFRHEVGHYYWDQLVASKPEELERFRILFGDETRDYGEALQDHYDNGAPENWPETFVSAYATMHPWEDWAETWAHYLHIVDTLETAYAFGMSLDAPLKPPASVAMIADFDPYEQPDFEPIMNACLPITFAVNSLNRSMGQPDLYPFVLPPAVFEKLRYVHQLVQP
ncbi:zinc-binding metallopeptidase family protein [Cerasicoccus maritimus]|uniref:zinc-binding metallopeptidase family protein n=1 Tax=Cerasicoccus maritimus TaxID=490089 RepID=UPI002852B110|nr:putative zinc-binding peptidase [Cerasicoccus maritimus]